MSYLSNADDHSHIEMRFIEPITTFFDIECNSTLHSFTRRSLTPGILHSPKVLTIVLSASLQWFNEVAVRKCPWSDQFRSLGDSQVKKTLLISFGSGLLLLLPALHSGHIPANGQRYNIAP